MLMTLIFWEKTIYTIYATIYTIQKNTEAVLDTSKEVGLEVNSEKTKYMLMSSKKAGQKHSTKIANRSFEDVTKFKYFGTTLTDQNCMQEETKSSWGTVEWIQLAQDRDKWQALVYTVMNLRVLAPLN
jgi:ribosomal protein S2